MDPAITSSVPPATKICDNNKIPNERENVIKATLDDLKVENFENFILHHEALGYKHGFLKVQPPPQFWTNVQLPDDIINRDLNCPHSQRMMAPRTRRIKVRREDGRLTSFKFYLQCLAPSDKISLNEFKKRGSENGLSSGDRNSKLFWTEAPSATPIYADEVEGSRCSLDSIYWSLPKLNSLLQRVCSYLGIVLFGVTTPYLYYGQWLTRFCWHVEDLMLFSISFLHEGADKTWYVIPPAYRDQFSRLVRRLCRREYRLNGKPKMQPSGRDCDNFLHHKTFLLNPVDLKKVGIPYTEVVQKEGEIMITFPGAYHSGFNHGFNCAEALNFAMPSWLPFGMEAKTCKHHNLNAVTLTGDMERVALYMEGLFKKKMGQADYGKDFFKFSQKISPPIKGGESSSSLMQHVFAKKSLPTTATRLAKKSKKVEQLSFQKNLAIRTRVRRLPPRKPVTSLMMTPMVRINRIKLVRQNDQYVIDEPKKTIKKNNLGVTTFNLIGPNNERDESSQLANSNDDRASMVIQGPMGSTKIFNCNQTILSMQDELPALVSGADLISFGAGQYQCLRCGREYNWKKNCIDHIRRIHKNFKIIKKPPKPPPPPPMAPAARPVEMKLSRKKILTPTTCPQCGKLMSSRGVVNRHLVQVHFLPPLENLSRRTGQKKSPAATRVNNYNYATGPPPEPVPMEEKVELY